MAGQSKEVEEGRVSSIFQAKPSGFFFFFSNFLMMGL